MTTKARRKRKDRTVEHTRRDIVDAAARAFARRGFGAATMEDIAGEAGYAVGTLYKYFDGKSAIVEALLGSIGDELEAVFEEPLLDALPFRQRFEAVLERQLTALERRRALFVALALERPGIFSPLGDTLEGASRVEHQRWVERIAALMRAGIDEGALRAGDVYEMGAFLLGAVNGSLARWLTAAEPPPPPAARARQLTDMVLFGLAPREEPRNR